MPLTGYYEPLPGIGDGGLQRISLPELDSRGVTLYFKRDDQIDRHIGGNKWRKLKYNIAEARSVKSNRIVTFGGRLSNHLVAVAEAGKRYGFETAGYVRDNPRSPSQFTSLAGKLGMQLTFVSDDWFLRDFDSEFLSVVAEENPGSYILPEGGSNPLGLRGVAESVADIDLPFSYICCACGSGGTLAGLVYGLAGDHFAIGISAWRGETVLPAQIESLLSQVGVSWRNYGLSFDYHLGGFGRTSKELEGVITRFRSTFDIRLDRRFTGKMALAIFTMAREGFFRSGDVVVALHSGLGVTVDLE
jgi:1-aminocyclopropane-1-carboxylate deaminase/D-cysteine desulfhydrase-like pyridoxal-dependent ACC family enzyme